MDVETLELVRRLDSRSKTPQAMPYDSSTAKIVQRLEDHTNKTIPVIEKYKEIHDVAVVNGTDSFEDVMGRVSAEIESSFKALD